jgi:hypothetical protein
MENVYAKMVFIKIIFNVCNARNCAKHALELHILVLLVKMEFLIIINKNVNA